MADIRIKDLATTATTTVSDDYLAIDGATNGTRKMSAYSPVFSGGVADAGGTIAAQRNALAPAQGLYFDGTGSQAVVSKAVPAIFTIAATVNPTTLGSSGRVIAGSGSSFEFGVSAAGLPYIYDGITVRYGTTAIVAGVATHIAYTRTGTTGVFYVNGVTAGTVTDSNTYGSITSLGGANSTSGMLGTISNFLLENRALSAAEVLALYQSGAVAAGDINSASNTNILSSADSTFSSDTGNWVLQPGSTISGGKLNIADTKFVYYYPKIYSAGQHVRIKGTLDSITGGALRYFNGSAYVTLLSAPGSFDVEYVQAVAGQVFINSVGGNSVLDNFYIYSLGALIAPEANAPGAGLEWLDVSGNRAHIVLPTSGVSWALPSSQQIVIEATTNTATNQQLGAASLIDTNKQWRIQSWTVNCSTGTPTISLGNASAGAQYVSALVLAAGNNDITLLTRFPTTANLWCNSSTTATLIHRIVLVPAN